MKREGAQAACRNDLLQLRFVKILVENKNCYIFVRDSLGAAFIYYNQQ